MSAAIRLRLRLAHDARLGLVQVRERRVVEAEVRLHEVRRRQREPLRT